MGRESELSALAIIKPYLSFSPFLSPSQISPSQTTGGDIKVYRFIHRKLKLQYALMRKPKSEQLPITIMRDEL